jgi:hypothetical protein
VAQPLAPRFENEVQSEKKSLNILICEKKGCLPEIPEIFNTFLKLSVMGKMKCQSAGSLALGFLSFKILFENREIFPGIPAG